MNETRDLIVRVLLAPAPVDGLSDRQWDLLIRQARRSNLLARLAHVLDRQRRLDAVPTAPRQHLNSAMRLVDKQGAALRWEIECIRQALADADVQIIVLKGAAYAMAGLEVAGGRIFTDVDILVPKTHLGRVESGLMLHGWQGSHHDAYDQRYYRRWMHEIPPMRHIRRGTTIDVHHTILPETARVKVNAAALFEAAVPLPGHPNLFVLQPTDMLLHSATHLFHEGEFENGLRDLLDLDSLLREFGADPAFWQALVPRAVVLGLTRPLYYALRYTTSLLNTPVPPSALAESEVGSPPRAVRALMDICYRRSLRPPHPSARTTGVRMARFALYLRSHWIRMPFPTLVVHLSRKALARSKGDVERKMLATARDAHRQTQ